jgi:hypothetical protein
MSEFKQGDTILVRNSNALDYVERVLVVEHQSRYYCEVEGETTLHPWECAKPLPKPEYEPFAQETFPRTPTLIRAKGYPDAGEYFVTSITPSGVIRHQGFASYANLLQHYEMLDGDKWVPAGVKL